MTYKETVLLEQAYQKVLESHDLEVGGFEGDLEKDVDSFNNAHNAMYDTLNELRKYKYEFEGEVMEETDYWPTAQRNAYEICKISPEFLDRLDKNGMIAEKIKASGQSYDKDTIELHISLAIDSKKLRELITFDLPNVLTKEHFSEDNYH